MATPMVAAVALAGDPMDLNNPAVAGVAKAEAAAGTVAPAQGHMEGLAAAVGHIMKAAAEVAMVEVEGDTTVTPAAAVVDPGLVVSTQAGPVEQTTKTMVILRSSISERTRFP